MIYKFKFFFTDGTSQFGDVWSKNPRTLYNDFDGLMDWNEFEQLHNEDLTVHQALELAMEVYKPIRKEYYRIEIVNVDTGEVVDYIDIRE